VLTDNSDGAGEGVDGGGGQHDRDIEHRITREGAATYYNVYGLSGDGKLGLELRDVEERGPCETKQTHECACGRSFYKEATAAEHLRSVGREDDAN